jgi:hypothetical protein
MADTVCHGNDNIIKQKFVNSTKAFLWPAGKIIRKEGYAEEK